MPGSGTPKPIIFPDQRNPKASQFQDQLIDVMQRRMTGTAPKTPSFSSSMPDIFNQLYGSGVTQGTGGSLGPSTPLVMPSNSQPSQGVATQKQMEPYVGNLPKDPNDPLTWGYQPGGYNDAAGNPIDINSLMINRRKEQGYLDPTKPWLGRDISLPDSELIRRGWYQLPMNSVINPGMWVGPPDAFNPNQPAQSATPPTVRTGMPTIPSLGVAGAISSGAVPSFGSVIGNNPVSPVVDGSRSIRSIQPPATPTFAKIMKGLTI